MISQLQSPTEPTTTAKVRTLFPLQGYESKSVRLAFWSSTPQQGKTTACRYLRHNHGFSVLSFADAPKRMVDLFLELSGIDKERIRVYRVAKDLPIPEFGLSYRDFCKSLATGWGRDMVCPTCWTDIIRNRIINTVSKVHCLCCDDMRFHTEREMLLEQGFRTVRIIRDVTRDRGIDDSIADKELRNLRSDEWDYSIWNNGTKAEFYQKIEEIVKQEKQR